MDYTEISAMICEISNALAEMRDNGLHGSRAYTMLWRRMGKLEEKLYRHPY